MFLKHTCYRNTIVLAAKNDLEGWLCLLVAPMSSPHDPQNLPRCCLIVILVVYNCIIFLSQNTGEKSSNWVTN